MSSGGQVIGGVIGAVVGFFTPIGPLYGAQIGMMVGGYLDPPKGPSMQGPRLNDLSVQTSTYGAVIPRLYGTAAVHGNVIWVEGNKLKEHVQTKKNKSGGKGGGPSAGTTTTYAYSASFAIGLCRGPIVGVRRIWIANELVYDAGSSDPEIIRAGNALASGWRLYTGSDTQPADPRIQADHGVANTPAWPGLAYIVFYDLDLTAKYSNTLAAVQVKVEVATGTAQSTFVQTAVSTGWNSGRLSFGACVFNGRIMTVGGHLTSDGWGDHTTNEIWTSGDGGVWSLQGTAGLGSSGGGRGSFDCVVFNDVIYGIAGQSGPVGGGSGITNDVISSIDGRLWIVDSTAPWEARYKTAVCVHDGAIIMAGGDAVTHLCKDVWRMDADGTWTQLTAAAPWVAAGGSGRAAAGLVSLNGYLYIMGGYGDPSAPGQGYRDVWRSADDGATWTQICADYRSEGAFPSAGAVESIVAWNNEIWVIRPASNNSNTVFWTDAWHSADGITWSKEALTAFPSYRTGGKAVVYNGSLFYVGGNGAADAWLFAYRVMTPGTVPLSTIVTAECLKSALLTSGDIDASALTSSVRGFTVSSAGSIRNALEVLQGAFPFDLMQSGYLIKFVPRGGSPVSSLDEGDLDARPAGEKPKDKFPITREMESQLPRVVSISYPDVDREYDANEQLVERITSDAVNEMRRDMAVVLSADEAAQVADVLMALYWLERYEVGPFTLPPTYRSLEPGDVITVSYAGRAYDIRLTRIEYGANGILTCQGRFASTAIYNSTAIGSAGSANAGIPLSLAGPSDLWLLDIPCLGSNHNTWGETAAVSGVNAGWKGSILYRSDDSGQSYSTIQGFDVGANVFRASTMLAVGRTDIPDAANTLTVSPLSAGAALFSCTYADQLNGSNLAALGAPGRWELINFRTVSAGSGSSLILRDFGRGLFGTEWAMTSHAADDLLVMLDYDALNFVGLPIDAYLSPRLWRAVTLGADFNDYVDTVDTYGGINLKPLSPVYVTGWADASGNWTIAWLRRTRLGGQWLNGIDVPLSESSEAYEIEIWDGTFTTKKRTLTATSATVSYSSALGVADFGAAPVVIGVKVYQISASVGRGYGTSKLLSSSADDNALYTRMILSFPLTAGSTAFTDLKGHAITPNGNAQTSITVVKSGFDSSAVFDGAGDYLELSTSADWGFAGRDKTVEAWIYTGTPGTAMCIVGTISRNGAGDTVDAGWALDLNGGKLRFGFHRGASSTFTSASSSASIPANTWVHVAVTATAGGVFKLWINGAQDGTVSSGSLADNTKPLRIGRTNDTGNLNDFNGYIARGSLRITDAVRYTAAFTPPSLPLSD